MEALNIVEDSIQDMCTCARNLGCNSAQDCYVYLCNGLCWTFLIDLFCYILCKFVWIFCVAQVEGAAQWLPRANPAWCLYCAQDKFLQRPINLSYLILSYLTIISLYCHFWTFSWDILRLRSSHRAGPEPMYLPTMTQVGCEHVTKCISLVHADETTHYALCY